MTTHRHRVPTDTVEIDEWNPKAGFGHVLVMEEPNPVTESVRGIIARPDGNSLVVHPGQFVVIHGTSSDKTFKLIEVLTAAEVAARYEPIAAPTAMALAAPEESASELLGKGKRK